MKITVTNEISFDGPPPSACPSARASSRVGCNGNARGMSHLNSRQKYSGIASNHFRPLRGTLQSTQVRAVQSHRHIRPSWPEKPTYNTSRGPVSDLRELLNRSSRASTDHLGLVHSRNFGSRISRNFQGHQTPSPSQLNGATFTRFGRHRPPRAAFKPAGPPARGRSYWHHDDQRFPYPTSDRATVPRTLDYQSGDEYIDDFNLEDFKLHSNMNTFPVQSSWLPDSSLSVLVDSFTASPLLEQVESAMNRLRHSRRGRSSRWSRAGRSSDRKGYRQAAEHSESIRAKASEDYTQNSLTFQDPLITKHEIYLKPAFQLWRESGLDSAIRQRRSSETIRRPIDRPTPTELFPQKTWPCLYFTVDHVEGDTCTGSDIIAMPTWFSQLLTRRSHDSGIPKFSRLCRSADDVRQLDCPERSIVPSLFPVLNG